MRSCTLYCVRKREIVAISRKSGENKLLLSADWYYKFQRLTVSFLLTPPQFHLFSILMFEETEVNIKYVFMSVKYQSTVAVDSEERFTSTLLHRHDVWMHRQVWRNWTAVFQNEIQAHENGWKTVDVRINIMAKVYGSHTRTLGSTCWKLRVHWCTILEFSKGKSFHPLKVKLLKITNENVLINHTEVSVIS